jgi:16S rRNA (guanine527-N7)-methyltransferase
MHADGFATVIGEAPERALDLGSGGGLPGLALALLFPCSCWLLLDSAARRAAFLEEAVRRLGVRERVGVRRARAEELGRDPEFRGTFGLVVARRFARPAITAECAAPFLLTGGRLVVSEPPGGEDRWPEPAVDALGLAVGERRTTREGTYQVLEQVRSCPDRFPRAVGIPQRHPLFS